MMRKPSPLWSLPLALWAAGCTGRILAPEAEAPAAPQDPPGMTAPVPGETPDAGPVAVADGGPPPPEGPPPLETFASAPPPSRMVRLDQPGYARTMGTLLDGRAPDETTLPTPPADLPSVFASRNPSDRFSTRARSYHIDAVELAQLEETSRRLAVRFVAERRTSCDLAEAACQSSLLAEAGARLLRRPLTEAEIGEIAAVSDDPDPEARLTVRLVALLLHPEAVFRAELGDDTGALSPLELASALSFTLLQSPPDEALYTRAVDGALTEPTVYAAEIARLMRHPAHANRVAGFVREFFGYAEAENVAKDESPQDVFPEDAPGRADARYRPERLVADTDALVAWLVAESRHAGFLEQLLTTDRVVAQPSTAVFYNLDEVEADAGPQASPSGQRAGLLTQPAWLVAYSETDHTNPIRRGLFVQESLLCGDVPPLPIDDVPELRYKEMTMREALAEHAVPGTTCHGCHRLMDPLGLPFEQFDHFGRFRTEERGAPVDTTGAVVWSDGELPISGDVATPTELLGRLARSPQVVRCFTRHALEYWFGRAPTANDARAVERAARAYEASGGDFDALLTGLLTSEVFRRRTQP